MKRRVETSRMRTIREILNEYRWRGDRDFSKIEVGYLHRGVKGERKILRGGDIKELGKSYIHAEKVKIPYHRVLEILYDGAVIFKRSSEAKRS